MADSKWLTGWLVMMIIVEGDHVRLMRVIDMARAGVCSCMRLCRRCYGIDVEPPHPGSCLFTEPLENDCPGFVDYFNVGPSEDNCASCIPESAHAEEVVCEGAHDVAVFDAQWQIWEEEFGLPNGLNALAIGNVDRCVWCIGGESCCRGLAVAVVRACPCVSDGSEVVVVM